MQKLLKIALILTVALGLITAGCSSSKKGQCGCPTKNGFIGY